MRKNKDFVQPETGQSTEAAYKVFLDTDIGDDIDDALALALALQSPEIELLGVSTVFGDTRLRAFLAAHLLAVFGRSDIPVAAGIGEPLRYRHPASGVAQAEVIPQHLPAPDISKLTGPELLIKMAAEYAGQLTLICIGPLTNLATALRLEPGLGGKLKRVIVMGGSSSVPLADWNIRSDIEAARIVLAAGMPLTCVGLDITAHCQLRQKEIGLLNKSRTSRARLLSELIVIWRENRPSWQPPYPFLHDPLTVAALCCPSVFTFQEMPLRLLTKGPLQGMTIPRMLGGTWVEAATQVEVEKVKGWMMKRWLA